VFQDGKLQCSQCPNSRRRYVNTGLVDANMCKNFGNLDGKLVCDLEENHSGVPEGSYLGSCGGCRVQVEMAVVDGKDEDGTTYQEEQGKTVLRCVHCRDSRGAPGGETWLNIDECKNVGNAEGVLVCEDHERKLSEQEAEDLPVGSYQESCRGCVFRDRDTPVLSCSACKTGKGTTTSARLGLARGKHTCKNIRNVDGRLRCDRYRNGELPPWAMEENAPKKEADASSSINNSESNGIQHDATNHVETQQATTSTEHTTASRDEL